MFLRVKLLKVIVLSRFLGKLFKDLIQTVHLPYYFYCLFWRYEEKNKKKL